MHKEQMKTTLKETPSIYVAGPSLRRVSGNTLIHAAFSRRYKYERENYIGNVREKYFTFIMKQEKA